MLAAVAVSDLGTAILKEWIDRPRPPARYPEPEPLLAVPATGSFPSGHAATSFASAVLLARAAPAFRVPLFLLAAGIAASRVYAGVHFPLDVLAGALFGIAVATAPRLLAAVPRRSPRGRRRG